MKKITNVKGKASNFICNVLAVGLLGAAPIKSMANSSDLEGHMSSYATSYLNYLTVKSGAGAVVDPSENSGQIRILKRQIDNLLNVEIRSLNRQLNFTEKFVNDNPTGEIRESSRTRELRLSLFEKGSKAIDMALFVADLDKTANNSDRPAARVNPRKKENRLERLILDSKFDFVDFRAAEIVESLIDDSEKNIDSIDQQVRSAGAKVKRAEAAVKRSPITTKINAADQDIKKRKGFLKHNQTQLNTKKSRLSSLQSELNSLIKKVQQLRASQKSLPGTLRTKEGQLIQAKANLAKAQADSAKWKKEKRFSKFRRNPHKKKIKRYKRQVAALDKEVQQISARIPKLPGEISETLKRQKSLPGLIAGLKPEVAHLEKTVLGDKRGIEKANQAKQVLVDQLSPLRKKVRAAKNDERGKKELKKDARNEVRELKNFLVSFENQIDLLNDLLKESTRGNNSISPEYQRISSKISALESEVQSIEREIDSLLNGGSGEEQVEDALAELLDWEDLIENLVGSL